MITLEELTAEIAELESKPTTYQNCERLAVLYVIQDRLQKETEQTQTTSSYVHTPETVNTDTTSSILPSYNTYIENKRKYQQGFIQKEKVLKNLETLSDEMKEFIKRLYRNSDMPEERAILNSTINNINVGNL